MPMYTAWGPATAQ